MQSARWHASGFAPMLRRMDQPPQPADTAAGVAPVTMAGGVRGRGRLTALIVATALLMEQMDGTVLATALPTMARSFDVDPLHMNVALTAYLLSLAVFIPASGKVADRFGARTVFRGAIVLFTAGSMLCGQAPSLAFLVGARIVQGIGGAMMVPVGRLVLLRTVSKSELVSAMAWLLVPATIGPVLGPPIGGFIVTYLSWRWIFYINVPIGLLGIVLATRYIQDVRESERTSFDLPGLALSALSLSCLMFGLEMASRPLVPPAETAGLLLAGLASGALYVRHARRHPRPVLDLRLMRIPTFAISVTSGSLFRITVGAMPFLLPMMLQLGFGLSAAQSGLVTFVSAAGSLAMRVCAPVALRRIGYRHALIWNSLLCTVVFATYAAFRPGWPVVLIYAALLVGGFFQSLQFTAYNTIAYADMPRARMSAATSFYSTFQQLSLSLGITVAALSLAASTALLGHARSTMADFSIAFAVLSASALLSCVPCLRLSQDAGDELSGHRTAGR
jgi:EmrB/QacA subfamily drug resistance transporter